MSDTIRSLLGDSAKASGYIQHQKELKRYDLPLDASVEDLEKAKKLAAEKDLVSQFSPDEFSLSTGLLRANKYNPYLSHKR